MSGRTALAAATALAVLLVACGEPDPVATMAGQACESFAEAGTPIERRLAEEDLLAALDDNEAVSIVDLLDRMRTTCPESAADMLLGSATNTERSAVQDQVSLDVEECEDESAAGTVTSEADRAVSVRVEVRFSDGAEVLLDTSGDVVSELHPGQTGRWEVYAAGNEDVDTCYAEIVQVVPHA